MSLSNIFPIMLFPERFHQLVRLPLDHVCSNGSIYAQVVKLLKAANEEKK